MQNFCILASFSKFLVPFNNCRRCIISASQENLTLYLCNTVFVNFHEFYRVQNFYVLVELVNFRPFKSIEQDAEILHPTKIVNTYVLAF